MTPIKNCSACKMGVTRQPVVQPHFQVHHGQGRLGHHGLQEVQRVRHELAERHGADCTALLNVDCCESASHTIRLTKLCTLMFHDAGSSLEMTMGCPCWISAAAGWFLRSPSSPRTWFEMGHTSRGTSLSLHCPSPFWLAVVKGKSDTMFTECISLQNSTFSEP